ncbi:TPA: phosphoethanolamine--lipid A transferase [Campylobacter lari]|uniref:phosphoethanolamine transferase n=1 Tax=Campylobacter sp. W0066.2 TaxID=2735752 RepID=UPI002983E5E7|nr:phosphoethanolamine--lipid A transferase [Campylobacter sp. W0066.2]HEG2581752.1 phosphoethanolamine--lipid A transferase [Campylobacter lari]
MKFLKVSWLQFVFLSAIYISGINLKLFSYIHENLYLHNNETSIILYIIIYFALLVGIFALLFLPYLSKILMIFLIGVSSISSYFMTNYGVIIDHDMIRNAVQTDQKEVFDLINFNIFIYIFFTFVIPTFLIIKTKIEYYSIKKHLMIKFSTLIVALIVAFGLVGIFSKSIVPFLRTYNKVRVYNTPFYQIYSAIKYIKLEVIPQKELQNIALDAKMEKDLNKTMVLIIGETARASNYSLGGYKTNDTNFYTKNEPNLVYFNNVSSCGTATAKSLPCMFSRHKKTTFNNSFYEENVLDILQRVGVKSIWLGNNSGGCKGNCDRIEHNLISKDYDESLIELVKEQLQNPSSSKIIVVHLQGSHGPTYYKRYPDKFKKFIPTCDTNELQKCSQKELINTYDNTLLYTDFIIKTLIDLLQKSPLKNASLLYISDHGESLGENGIYLHGMPYFIAPKEQTHIPMIFWSKDGKLSQDLQSKKNYKLSQDNLFSSLLGYFGVNSKEYEANYDIFSKNLEENP